MVCEVFSCEIYFRLGSVPLLMVTLLRVPYFHAQIGNFWSFCSDVVACYSKGYICTVIILPAYEV